MSAVDTPTPTNTVPMLALNAKQAAQALSISPRKLWELTNRKEIRCARFGRAVRYHLAELNRYLESQVKEGK